MKKISTPKFKLPKAFYNIGRYTHTLIFVLYSILVGLVIFYADYYSKYEPSIVQVQDKKDGLKLKRIDETSLNKLKELDSRNISLEALFDNGRNNPFEN